MIKSQKAECRMQKAVGASLAPARRMQKRKIICCLIIMLCTGVLPYVCTGVLPYAPTVAHAAGFTFTATGWRAPDKDPVAILDYTIDWSEWLDTDTITSSTWEASTGITITATSGTTTATTVWLSGGTAMTKYEITNQISTLGGRTTRQSFIIWVRDQ